MKIIEMTTNLKMMIHIVRVAISLSSAKSDSAKYEMRNIAMTMTMDVKATLHNFAIAIYRVPVFFSTPKYMSLLSIYRQRCSPQTNYILPALPPCTLVQALWFVLNLIFQKKKSDQPIFSDLIFKWLITNSNICVSFPDGERKELQFRDLALKS